MQTLQENYINRRMLHGVTPVLANLEMLQREELIPF